MPPPGDCAPALSNVSLSLRVSGLAQTRPHHRRNTQCLLLRLLGFDPVLLRGLWNALHRKGAQFRGGLFEDKEIRMRTFIVLDNEGNMIHFFSLLAAGDFIVDPKSLLKMAKSLPADWEKKNVEIVIHTTVKNQLPSPAEVVAAYCW